MRMRRISIALSLFLVFQILLSTCIHSSPLGEINDTPQWSMYGGGPQGNGRSQYSCSDNPGRPVWTYGPIFASGEQPAIGKDGTIYIGDTIKNFHAINPDGTRKWIMELTGNATGPPAIGPEGNIYFGTDDGNIFCIDEDGMEKWRHSTVGQFNGPIRISDEGLLVTVLTDPLHINRSAEISYPYLVFLGPSGDLVKECHVTYFQAVPAIGEDGTIYVNNYNSLMAYYPNGTEKWTYRSDHSLDLTDPKVLSNGNILIRDLTLKLISPEGELLFDSMFYEGTDRAVIGFNDTIYTFTFNEMSIFDSNLRRIEHYPDIGGFVETDVVIDRDGNVLFGDGNSLKMVDKNGDLKWVSRSGSFSGYVSMLSPVIMRGGTIICYDETNLNLMALGMAPPAKVKDLKAYGDDREVSLSWKYQLSDYSQDSIYMNHDGFRIYRRINSEGAYDLVADIDPTNTTYTDDIGISKFISYKVTAYDGEYESNPVLTSVERRQEEPIIDSQSDTDTMSFIERNLLGLIIVFGLLCLIAAIFIISMIILLVKVAKKGRIERRERKDFFKNEKYRKLRF